MTTILVAIKTNIQVCNLYSKSLKSIIHKNANIAIKIVYYINKNQIRKLLKI